jgi:hypothetical protein
MSTESETMSTDTGIVIPEPVAPMPLTPLPSPETAYTAVVPIIEVAESYGNNGNVYPDSVTGLDIGYCIQLLGAPTKKYPAGNPNTANIPYILEAMGVSSTAIGPATVAVVGA